MDDIARDPGLDPQVVPEHGHSRLRGPVPEFAVEDSTADGAPDARDASAQPRLPRVMPLPPVDDAGDDGDDDLLPPLAASETEASDGPRDDELDAGPPAPEPEPGAAGDGEVPAPDALPASVEPIDDPQKLVRVVFGLLLASREGISVLRLAQVCETTQEAVRAALDALRRDLAAVQAPLELTPGGETFKLWTTPDVFPYLEALRGIKKSERLSPAAVETLAVIAYRQPVFRAEIEAIRGVKVGPMLRTLLDCKLVKVVGRADVPGRPLQYGTTQQFLERFGLTSLADLPSVKEFKGLSG